MKKQDIKELMKFFSMTENISRMKLKHDDVEIELEKQINITQAPSVVAPAPVAAPVVQETFLSKPVQVCDATSANCISSPMVGTFYQAPAPGAKAFVQVGDTVSKGQTIAIVEAMKIMNEIEAEYDCKILKILVEDGQPVEYDMSLFEVEKL